MKNYFKHIMHDFLRNSTKLYLVLAAAVLAIFAIVFANAGMLPFKTIGDFVFFAVLGLMLAIYRPGWAFLFFIASLALENINLVPTSLGFALRPYQYLAVITTVAIGVGFYSKRLTFVFPKWRWYDALIVLFAIAGFLSGAVAQHKGASFKQALVALSFALIYFLVRVYVQSYDDLKRITPFFISTAVVVAAYGMWQNIRFMRGMNPFEVMPGRPNGTFSEADWFGIYLVFFLSIIFTIIYNADKKTRISNDQFPIFNPPRVDERSSSRVEAGKFSIIQFFNYVLLTLTLIVLILAVSRSAWLGAVIVTIVFLKIILTQGSWRISAWQWGPFFGHAACILVAIAMSAGIVLGVPLTRFQLVSRAQSTGGLQKITVACIPDHTAVPPTIGDVGDLPQYGCSHINLEDIEKEKSQGNVVLETSRPDPNISIRAKIYQKSIAQIKAHPIFGIGWGSISQILGTDERGAGLNASNIFLETWLGSGLLGILSLVALLGYILIRSVVVFVRSDEKTAAVFVLLGWFAVVVPNLFNSGIFLGFVWAYLAVAVSLLATNTDGKNFIGK